MNKFDELRITLCLAGWLKDKTFFSMDELKRFLIEKFGQKLADDYLSSLDLSVDLSSDFERDKEIDFETLYNEEDV